MSDIQIVIPAAVKPNLADTLHDVREKPLPMTFVTTPPVEADILVEKFGTARSTSIRAGEPSTIGAWAIKCDT